VIVPPPSKGLQMRLALIAACLAAAGCKKAPPAQPRFCDQDLSGVWLNSSDRHFAYRFRDDGGVVAGEFLERADDGVLAAPAPPITFDLRRSQDTIAGVMRSTATTPGGRTCPTEFETRITDCKPDALQVVSETSAQTGEDCKRLSAEDGGALPRDLTEFRFERAPQRN
jgi:hypothetical protein